MFPRLEKEENEIIGTEAIEKILNDPAFSDFGSINILPLIYDENEKKCNILVFDYKKAKQEIYRITKEVGERGRKHPVYRFYNEKEQYICEVRYGSATANALQRDLWSHTKIGIPCFDSITNGWIDYSHNKILVKLFSHALVSTQSGHETAFEKIKEDIKFLQEQSS